MSVVTSQCQLAAPSQPGAEDTAEVSAMITLTIEAVNTEPLNKQGNQLKYNLRLQSGWCVVCWLSCYHLETDHVWRRVPALLVQPRPTPATTPTHRTSTAGLASTRLRRLLGGCQETARRLWGEILLVWAHPLSCSQSWSQWIFLNQFQCKTVQTRQGHQWLSGHSPTSRQQPQQPVLSLVQQEMPHFLHTIGCIWRYNCWYWLPVPLTCPRQNNNDVLSPIQPATSY